jgi:hypothetical protein
MGWFLFPPSLFRVFQTAACRQILKAGCIACRARQERTSSRSCACTTCPPIRTLVRCSCLGRFRASFPSSLHTFILILILPSLCLAPFPFLSSPSFLEILSGEVGGDVAPHRDLPADFLFWHLFSGHFSLLRLPPKVLLQSDQRGIRSRFATQDRASRRSVIPWHPGIQDSVVASELEGRFVQESGRRGHLSELCGANRGGILARLRWKGERERPFEVLWSCSNPGTRSENSTFMDQHAQTRE